MCYKTKAKHQSFFYFFLLFPYLAICGLATTNFNVKDRVNIVSDYSQYGVNHCSGIVIAMGAGCQNTIAGSGAAIFCGSMSV